MYIERSIGIHFKDTIHQAEVIKNGDTISIHDLKSVKIRIGFVKIQVIKGLGIQDIRSRRPKKPDLAGSFKKARRTSLVVPVSANIHCIRSGIECAGENA